jgi:DNA polymerase-3 subunit gamma/tau
MRDALSIMDQAIASAPVENGQPRLSAEQIRELMGTVPNAVFERLMESIGEGHAAAVIEELNRLLNAGNSPAQLARQFVRYLRNVLMARIGGEESELLQISPDERARAARSAVLFSEEDLTRFLQVMLRTFDELNYRQEQRFHLELGLIKLVHLQRLLPVEDLLSQLPTPQGGKTGSGGGPLPQKSAAGQGRAQSSGAASASRASAAGSGPVTPTRESLAPPRETTPISPFEADRGRKAASELTGSAAAQVLAAATTPVTTPRTLTPLEAASRAVETATPKAPVAAVPEPQEATSGALALAAAADGGAAPDLDRVREAVCSALENAGHNTAAVLLDAGTWRENSGTIEVEVGIKKTMLSLTMNAEAEKICREALRGIGETRKLVFLPGENGGSGTAKAPRAERPAAQGSIQAIALENPLVRQAQELFQAEVRSVLDLREKK